MEGQDVLACAMTGSGKTAAFLLPILQHLHGKPRGVTRALVITPTRELAAQIDEHRRDLARFTRLSGAAVYGGVGMGPQETAFRRGVDIIVATPGRLLDHFQYPYATPAGARDPRARRGGPDARHGLSPGRPPRPQAPARRKRQTLFFSATLPPPIVALSREMLHAPVAINVERPSAPATGITHAVYPVASELKSGLLLALLAEPGVRSVLAFTRTKHRANRLADFLARHDVPVGPHPRQPQPGASAPRRWPRSRTARSACSSPPTSRRAGIDITALSHVVNFDVPAVPEDYIHRAGRTARAEARGRFRDLRVARRGGGSARDRAGHRPPHRARDAARVRLQEARGGAARGAPGRADRRHPREEGPGARGRARQRGAPGPPQRASRIAPGLGAAARAESPGVPRAPKPRELAGARPAQERPGRGPSARRRRRAAREAYSPYVERAADGANEADGLSGPPGWLRCRGSLCHDRSARAGPLPARGWRWTCRGAISSGSERARR